MRLKIEGALVLCIVAVLAETCLEKFTPEVRSTSYNFTSGENPCSWYLANYYTYWQTFFWLEVHFMYIYLRKSQFRSVPTWTVTLRSFPCFSVRSSSAHEGKIIIFERFQCSLTNIIQLNWHLVKLIGKIEICLIEANFCKTRPRLPSQNEQKTPMAILAIFCIISPKQVRWPSNFFPTNLSYDHKTPWLFLWIW